MLRLTRPDFNKIKSVLLRQKKEVQEDLQRLQKDDPVFDQGLLETVESGEASWMADVHTKAVALKDSLTQILKKTEKSLDDLEKGKYGKCEKCGKQIEAQRLAAFPTATLCISCSKKFK